jgi:hypothetical protein
MFFVGRVLFYSQITPILLKCLWFTQGVFETRFDSLNSS